MEILKSGHFDGQLVRCHSDVVESRAKKAEARLASAREEITKARSERDVAAGKYLAMHGMYLAGRKELEQVKADLLHAKLSGRIPPNPEQEFLLSQLAGEKNNAQCVCGCCERIFVIEAGIWVPIKGMVAWHHIDYDPHNNLTTNFAPLYKWCHVNHHSRERRPILLLKEWIQFVVEATTGQLDFGI